jgi:hypothetical protein
MHQHLFVSYGLISIFFFHTSTAGYDGSKGFQWSASVDRASGLAYSNEVSVYSKQQQQQQQQQHSDDNDDDAATRMVHCFLEYPKWLCQGSVTLGLLNNAVPRAFSAATSSCCSQVRLFGRNGPVLLEFGPPVMVVKQQQQGTSVVVVQFPMMGGWMVAQPPHHNNNNNNSGCLQFAVTTTNSNQTSHSRVIETNLIDYRPRLLLSGGGCSGVTGFRSALYLKTQSLVHAYVMWRFHRYCKTRCQPANKPTGIRMDRDRSSSSS